ncbi:MAG: cation:proton antiporter [Acidimicrobiales bacterium]
MEHGLDTEVIVVVAAATICWSLVSARLDRLSITPALAFVAVGLVVANPPLSIVDIDVGSETVRSLAEVTLALVLFSDAAAIDLRKLRRDAGVPARLLLIGLPLTVASGVGLGLALFADLDVWLCAVIAAAVAPTDAALGAPLMADRRMPSRIRRELNVESGLNDGLVTPLVTFFIAGAVAEAATQPDLSPGAALVDLALGLLAGAGLGLIGGVLLRLARRRSWTNGGAEALAVLALALFAYAATLELGGNGFVAAFVAGLAFGATRQDSGEVLGFTSEAGELLAIVVWFVFGAVAVPVLGDVSWSALAFAVLALTVARMVPLAVALIGTGMSGPTVAFIGWFGPRGLASVVFALIAYDEVPANTARTTMLGAVVATVLLSVVAHGLTARPLAGRYAAYVRENGRPADHRPAPEPTLRQPLARRRTAPADVVKR